MLLTDTPLFPSETAFIPPPSIRIIKYGCEGIRGYLIELCGSSAEEMSGATEELSHMAQELQRLVEQFQVKEEKEEVLEPRRIA